ncbi:MAG: PKD domain-containing protein, partial [Candidatus Portnoybacteria bacterium]
KPATDYPPTADAGPDLTALVGQEIAFDGSNSSDPDWDSLSFFWNFGDGATSTQEKIIHKYEFPGQYVVSLSVEDNKFTNIDLALVNIYSPSIIISEFAPGKWIELYNQGDNIANLTGWQLNDFIFENNSFIGPNQFLVLSQSIFSDRVQLLYPDGSLASQISYSENKENSCIAFDGNRYSWTEVPTPAEANIISSILENTSQKTLIDPSLSQVEELDDSIESRNLMQNVFSVEDVLEDKIEETKNKNILENQSANLSSRVNSKAELILLFSIVLSGSLFLSWILILLKNRAKTH